MVFFIKNFRQDIVYYARKSSGYKMRISNLADILYDVNYQVKNT